jgi:hypothetical protein
MSNRFIRFFSLCLLISFPVYGKEKQLQTSVEGLVIDSLTGKGIPYVQIFNESIRENATTNLSGYFKLTGSKNDTLVFTALGYLGKVWIPSTKIDGAVSTILMARRVYDIEPVKIVTLPGSYKDFKKTFLEIKPEQGLIIDGLPNRYIPKLVSELLDTSIISTTSFFLMHPVSYLWYNYSKEEKSKRKVLYLQQEQKEQVAINQKFNRELVHRITELKENELTAFINFCNFSHLFLYNSTDYEIVEAIHKKFEEYKNSHLKTR